jgi:tRNA pseudouridine32 synthase / 23S rRNA pseudouridine746 synthase
MWAPEPRQGVHASRVGVGSKPYHDVLHFLCSRFPHVADWPARLLQGDVLSAQGQPLNGTEPCHNGMLIWYWRSPPPEPRVPFEVTLLHQCEHLVVVDKPHFLPVTPGGRHLQETVLVRLRQQLGIHSLAPMHRLDRDTAGVLVFTVQPHTRNAYNALLRLRQVHKVYEAIAPWQADLALPLHCHSCLQDLGDTSHAGFMQTQVVEGQANAHMLLELLKLLEPLPEQTAQTTHRTPLAHYRLTPSTGRRHQLRAQMNALGLSIVGDRIYPELLPDLVAPTALDYGKPLQLLAREFSFTDPITQQPRSFVSRLKLTLAPDAGV